MGYSLARPVATHTTTERALCSCLCMPELRSASWCRDGDGRFAGEIDRKYSTRSRVRPVRPGPRPEHVGAGAFPNAAYPTRLGFGQTDRRRRRLRSKGSCGAIRCRLHLDIRRPAVPYILRRAINLFLYRYTYACRCAHIVRFFSAVVPAVRSNVYALDRGEVQFHFHRRIASHVKISPPAAMQCNAARPPHRRPLRWY